MILSIEMKMLFWSAILGIVQLLLAAAASTNQRSLKWNLSSRDEQLPPLKGTAGRIERAFKNFMETFPFFIVATVIVQITGMANTMSELGAQLYFWARVIYVPIYALGVIGARTLIWSISMIGLVMVLSALV